jgi:hypothetical protein
MYLPNHAKINLKCTPPRPMESLTRHTCVGSNRMPPITLCELPRTALQLNQPLLGYEVVAQRSTALHHQKRDGPHQQSASMRRHNGHGPHMHSAYSKKVTIKVQCSQVADLSFQPTVFESCPIGRLPAGRGCVDKEELERGRMSRRNGNIRPRALEILRATNSRR